VETATVTRDSKFFANCAS